MSVKKKNLDDFKSFYNIKYKDIINNYYKYILEEEKSIITHRFIILVIFVILFIVYTYFFGLKNMINHNIVYMFLIFFFSCFTILLLSARVSLNKLVYKMNEYIIKDIIAFISENNEKNISFEPKQMLSKDSFSQMDLFNLDVVKYTGKNYIRVPYNKNALVFSDMETYTINIVKHQEEIYKNGRKYIRTTRKREKSSIFKGLYIGATLNKNNTNHIYLIPNNLNDLFLQSKIMNYISYHGVEVVLENLDFSKKYKVLCDDEISARYILSLSLMERINKLDEIFKEKKYIVFKEGKRFAICLEGVSIEKLKKIKMPYHMDEEKILSGLTNIYNNINKLFQIYHILDLGNDVYADTKSKVSQNASSPSNSVKNIIPINANNSVKPASVNNGTGTNIIPYRFDFENNYSFIINVNKNLGSIIKSSPTAYKIGNCFNIMIARCSDEFALKQRANEWMKVSANKNEQIICDGLDKEYSLKNNLKIYEKTVSKEGKNRYYKFFFYNKAMVIIGYSNPNLSATIHYSLSTIRRNTN